MSSVYWKGNNCGWKNFLGRFRIMTTLADVLQHHPPIMIWHCLQETCIRIMLALTSSLVNHNFVVQPIEGKVNALIHLECQLNTHNVMLFQMWIIKKADKRKNCWNIYIYRTHLINPSFYQFLPRARTSIFQCIVLLIHIFSSPSV